MSIEDIAKLAGVSISTVSKIVNGKDEGISAKTREHVLAIVKEYNYRPYSKVINNTSSKSFLLGFLMANRTMDDYTQEILKGVIARVQKDNYAVLVCDCDGDDEQRVKNTTMFCRSNVDGVITDSAVDATFLESNIPVISMGVGRKGNDARFAIDYQELGYSTAYTLVKQGHVRIGCVCDKEDEKSLYFWQGIMRCLIENGISVNEEQDLIDGQAVDAKIFERMFTAFICIDERKAGEIKRLALGRGLRIPESISLISLCTAKRNPFAGEISMMMLPLKRYGEELGEYLINIIEKRKENDFSFSWGDIKPDSDASITTPYDSSNQNILVVGSVNMDVFLNMEEIPQAGKTVMANSMSTIPGGKGLNQAIGSAKLGANVSLITRVGADYEGAGIYALLRESKVDLRGVMRDESQNTGRAYIYVRPGGDSSIVVYAGANKNLQPEDIERNERIFKKAGYCLLPMELSLETVGAALKMAKKHNVKTILKPSAMRNLPDEFFQMVDYFVPNEAEAELLCPQARSVEEKAQVFLNKGAETVIITLGAKGCYVASAKKNEFYRAIPVRVTDTTGGADAFISALAVYLNEQCSFEKSLGYALKAAGFCVSRHGTLPAMVDRTTLESHIVNM